MNDKLTEIRRKLYQELSSTLARNVLKGSRWILLKNPENLSKERGEDGRLDEALRMNEPLAKSYYLKEDHDRYGTRATSRQRKPFCKAG
jgi:hypothetical protein